MNKNLATLTASRAVQAILDRGAQKLYDKYLQQKLPFHVHERNDEQFHNNMKILSVKHSQQERMEVVASRIVHGIPIDNLAVKRIGVKRCNVQGSVLKPSEMTVDRSTKYQTIVQSQGTINQHGNHSKDIEDSMLIQDNGRKSPLFVRTERPSTMQVGRTKAKDDSNTHDQFKIQEVEEKRAATCHVRKRKTFATIQAEKKRFVELKEEVPLHLREEVEQTKLARKDKMERNQRQELIDQAIFEQQERARQRERKTMQDFQALKKSLKGKSKKNPQITNFQNNTGEIIINGKPKVPQTHIIQLQFNPEEEERCSTLQPKHCTVHATKTKSIFTTKLKKKLKLSDEEFTNNGSRQISSIPFVALNYGIAITQNGLQATASRRRPSHQISRIKFTEQQHTRFKSHIPIVNTARINIFSTLDPDQTARSSFIQQTQSLQKHLQTTFQSKNDMQRSLLWNPRGKSQAKCIRVSNKELLHREMLESKLALAQ